MKKFYLGFAAIAMLAVACNKEQAIDETLPVEEGKVLYEIKVTIDPETKGVMTGKSFAFSSGDEIAVIVTEAGTPSVETLSVTANDGTTVTFAASLSSEAEVGDYAYYPASIANAATPTTINWPSSFDGATCGGCVVPMMAKIEGNTAEFKHLGAMLKVNVADAPASIDALEFTTSSNFTGTYDVNTTTWALTANTLGGNVETVSVNGNGEWFIPIPAGTYADFRLAMKDGSAYLKQKTANLASAIAPGRTQIVNLGDFTYDIDEIAEWWHISEINGFQKGYDRYIKTGDNTYTITAFSPEANEWWRLRDGSDYDWTVNDVDGDTYWSGTLNKTGMPFHRDGSSNKTFFVTLTKNNSNWNYNSGNWDSESDRKWNASSSSVIISYNGNNYAMSKYDFDANYGYKYEGLTVSNNDTHSLKFILNWSSDPSNNTPSGVSGSLIISDSHPYGTAEWAGSNNIDVVLTPGTYNVYLDLAVLNFMFVKQ